jgi:hypothetical protein
MRTAWKLALVVAALAIPVSASAAISPADYKNTSKFCKALRAEMGTTAFKQAYGTNKNRSNAHGKCVSKNAETIVKIHDFAVTECKSQGAKPLGQCISSKEEKAEDAHQDAIVNAAKTCRAERSQDADAFREKYGTNKNKRNAFGKCVSKLARENEEGDQS